ncbi:PREDICTED: E3 ubiquitin-protein ligase ORTHRUS 2-like isoform X3 [Ipomoea nil]|uniref:E3 ubiquitin-protein ligase ORTHRUS 2-like isoform X3 n=1 Tax=Ipomoea nil TaxID=35883 RepID=UPI0009017C25|nr:PREDICTED: E3 ubiquitin-protein ligase ORTHRUS 2-like isoform X3 [Ipomoea nil]
MAHVSQLPVDGDGVCMLCKGKPAEEETLTCATCVTPWHVACLAVVPESLASCDGFECPDCAGTGITGAPAPVSAESGDLVAKIRSIEADESLTEKEKARRRQELLSGKADQEKGKEEEGGFDVLSVLGESIKCSFCMQLPDRPVTTPCGHNFCLKCFQKWIGQGKRTCAKCRRKFPPEMVNQPRINSTLVAAIRMAKVSRTIATGVPQSVYHYICNQDRPDNPFTTDRAKKNGMANASSGRTLVTVPKDHFGPIPAENDPERNQGVLVGETWKFRVECCQWGIHRPPVAGIAGQSKYGAQSVVLSGGYEDDEDHGEWFLYTGSGGRDLSGNKRTNKNQSFDQTFDNLNQALLVSCEKGYPVRVVRSEKEKRSSYAPEKHLRYDGVYRIEKCWRKIGKQGFKMCRYLFVRCDNEPAPWTSDEHGDRPRPLPDIPELKKALDVFERTESPSWDYDEAEERWRWKKPPPPSKQKQVVEGNPEDRKRARKAIKRAQHISLKERLLKGFSCLLCGNVLNVPLTTPCAHNFCKACLEKAFEGQTFTKERGCQNGRKLRSQKNIMKCPVCTVDISEFLQNPQVNRELMDAIEKLQSTANEDDSDTECSSDEEANATEKSPTKTSPESSGIEMPTAGAEDMHANASEENSKNATTEEKAEKTNKRRKTTEAGESSNNVDNDVTDKVNPNEEPCNGNNLQVAEENGHGNGDKLQATSEGSGKPPCNGNKLQVEEENGHGNGDNLQAATASEGNEKPKAGRRGRPKGSTNNKSH